MDKILHSVIRIINHQWGTKRIRMIYKIKGLQSTKIIFSLLRVTSLLEEFPFRN